MEITKNSKLIDDIPETFWAYLAGLIDGEGCVQLKKRFRKIDRKRGYTIARQFTISNMHFRTIEWIRQTCQFGIINSHSQSGKYPSFSISFRTKELRVILPKLIPYLKQKKELSKLMVEWVDTLGDDRHANSAKPSVIQKREEILKRFERAELKEKSWKKEYSEWHFHEKNECTQDNAKT